MFSTNVVEGASKVADAVDMMADRSAPKNATCSINGMRSITRVGNTFWGSSLSSACAVSGITKTAAVTTNIGMKANSKYNRPPITGPLRAVAALLDDMTR